MPIRLYCKDAPLGQEQAEAIFEEVRARTAMPDDDVTVRCVSEDEVRELNVKYMKKDAPTNVLTFSYEGEHDIALCAKVAKSEAKQRALSYGNYFALLIVHALLHASGMDHERSEAQRQLMNEMEEAVLASLDFDAVTLEH